MPRTLFGLSCAVLPVLALSAAAPASVARVAPEFPFVISYGGATNATSVAHFLGAPAGAHGFVRVKDGHFATDAGPIRFNGTGLTGPANFPSHADADRLAARLARLGINIVRLHFMDVWYSTFQWGDTPQQCLLAADRTTQRRLDPVQFERLDYLVAALKARGVYVDMNLHVGRQLDSRDGFVDDGPWANKTVGHFMPQLIAAQKNYARDLFTHVNSYTKNSYAREPAVAMVEISNEDENLWSRWSAMAKWPVVCRDELARQWDAWRRGKGLAPAAMPFDPEACPARLKMDVQAFFDDVEIAFYTGMARYLHDELGVRPPVSGTQTPGYSPCSVQSRLDYVDGHAYWLHPEGDGSWSSVNGKGDWRGGGISMVNSLHELAYLAGNSRVAAKPYTVSEYGHPFPNPFGGESQVMGCAVARLLDWDGLFQYSYNHYRDAFEPQKMPWCVFDGLATPGLLVHFPVCSALLVRGDLVPDPDAQARLFATRSGQTFTNAAGTFAWNREITNRAYLAVSTPQSKLFTGFPEGRTIALGDVSLRVGPTRLDWATVSLVSRNATGFGRSGAASLLVAATGDCGNTGRRIEALPGDSRHVRLLDRGHAPVEAEGVPAEITLPAAAGRVRCWALGPDGERRTPVSVINVGTDSSRIVLSPNFRTVWYEVVITGAAGL